MQTAFLGGLDALAFTGGIGMNDAMLRERITRRLGWLGVAMDARLNVARHEGRISTADSRVAVWSLETNEELMVARGCLRVLEARDV
jgi:acetate kinase